MCVHKNFLSVITIWMMICFCPFFHNEELSSRFFSTIHLRFCFSVINNCASSPCKNGATCSNGINNYKCACTSGYTAVNCDQSKFCFTIMASWICCLWSVAHLWICCLWSMKTSWFFCLLSIMTSWICCLWSIMARIYSQNYFT